ncbi:50S ribosomal protein L4 [Candidatus Saccharibacteria bacterium RIFCSPHIGHO2_12_FULL_49_19]|nr:MAG: 50S ribosomal protein L4 [Candidatus Saccharibacteria bacterium RIFCSPHIGHO2_01_FULL_49_21]OGL37798.1 MAG: 50S ribosomal protein L4 [Candidatus Saccharibacteria bacterium RIFCSPHIGHO2_12_FULL_49_19]OGL38589.1 MAG: 50S ribosomal protein L4 [Candidatus Saccharibacteria bacterium RIFCSPLOWO2_01_FULL_49_22]
MSVTTYTKSGSKSSTPVKLDKKIFGTSVKNHELLKTAYLSYLAGNRSNLAKTKKRGEVRGGGQKPWRQKGTGRARFGSSRNPIWVGGGVAFGPTGEENYRLKINVRAKRLALRQALSLAASEDRIRVIEAFESKDGRVSQTSALLKKLGLTGAILVVVSPKDALIERATRNLRAVKAVEPAYLNVFDVMNATHILISRKALEAISQRLGDSK